MEKGLKVMTVLEYRQKHPDCEYCHHNVPPFDVCLATNKRKSKRRAKKCSLYIPEKWPYEKEKDTTVCVDCAKMTFDTNGILKAIYRPNGSGEIYTKGDV